MTALSEALREAMHRVGVGAQTLSKLTGVPRTAIDNWRDGTVRRPRHWRPLARIARALGLSPAETDALLAAAGYQPLAALAGELPAGHPDRELLQAWFPGPAPPAAARHQLRAPVGDFVGREAAIRTLTAALGRELHPPAAAVAGIRGMAGAGKTELAMLVAHQLRNAFPDGQLLLQLRGTAATPTPPEQLLRQVIHALTPQARPGDDEQLEQRYRAALHGQRVLLVADDARAAAQVRPLLPPTGCALLLTSRHRFTLPGMATVDLEPLPESDAVALVRATSGRLGDQQARAIARACGGLPLALRVCGTTLHNNPALAVDDYLRRLVDQRHRLDQLRDPDDPEADVAASLALSYAQLDEPARHGFCQLGVLVADFDTELARAVVRLPAGGEPDQILHLLLRRSLVMYDPAGRRWRLHDLVRDLACARLRQAGGWEEAMWRYAAAAVGAATAIQRRYHAGRDTLAVAVDQLDAQRSHLDAARRWAARHPGDPRADSLLVADNAATTEFGFLRYDIRREVTPQARQALAAARRLGDLLGQATALERLGKARLSLGQARPAIGYFEQSLALVRRLGHRAPEARVLNDLGAASMAVGDLRRAILFYQDQLAVAQASGDRRSEAMALCNLGQARIRRGEPDAALACLRPSLAIARELGNQHGESIVLDNLGSAELERGAPERALGWYEQALAVADQLAQPFLQAALLPDLATAEVALGRPERAVEHCQRALAICHEIGARQFEGPAQHVLATAYLALSDTDRARSAFEQALAVLGAVGDSYGVARCSWDFGLALVGAAQPERGLALLHAAVRYEQEIGHARAAEHAAYLALVPQR